MPIRCFIDLGCTPREELGPEELLSLTARWQQAESISAQFREKHGNIDEAKMRFRHRFTTLGGESDTRELSVAELRRECEPLWLYSQHCARCPAALEQHPYSCLQSIAFPISARAQAWLVGQLAPEGSRVFELFMEAASRNGYGQSKTFENWRKAGFLEGGEPAKINRAGLLITSDMVLNELLLVGDLQPTHALGVLLHLQALAASDGRRGDDLLSLIEKVDENASAEDAPTIDFAIPPSDDDDASTLELKQFLFALFRAFSLQVPLAVRL